MALFLLVAAVGVHGSNNVHKDILPLQKSDTSGMDHQCLTLNTSEGDNPLRNSPPQPQAEAIPQAWAGNEAAGGLPWGPAVAGGSLGCLAIDGISLPCAKSEEQADDIRLSGGLGLDPGMGLGACPGAAAAAGESRVPSLIF